MAWPPKHPWALILLGLLAVLGTGCSGPRSYVVLLPSPDGSVGKVMVTGSEGKQLLNRAQSGIGTDGGKQPFLVSSEKLAKDFGAAMGASPAYPERFLLYFTANEKQLTEESRALLPTILTRAKTRAAVDLSIIGHTDTRGDAKDNEMLGLKRAHTIARLLRSMGLINAPLSVESHGERNLFIPTPDDTKEPLNRCVEVTLH